MSNVAVKSQKLPIVTRLQEIRETQTKLLGVKSQTAWMLLYREKTGQINSKTTLWYWEKDEATDPQYRPPNIRYLRFLCEEFNYNPEYILGIADEPIFNYTSIAEENFPELDRIVRIINANPVLGAGFRKILVAKDPDMVRELHLVMFHKYPDLYDKFLSLVNTFEEHPEFFTNGYQLPPK